MDDELAEFLGVVLAGLFHHAHPLPGRHAQRVIVGGGVPVQREGLEALLTQIEQGGQAGNLLLGAEGLQALAHGAADPAAILALGADGLFVQAVGGVAPAGEQLRPARLELAVLLPHLGDAGGGVGGVVEGGGGQRHHGGAELGINALHLGQGGIDLRLQGAVGGGLLRAALIQPDGCPADDLGTVWHGGTSFGHD